MSHSRVIEPPDSPEGRLGDSVDGAAIRMTYRPSIRSTVRASGGGIDEPVQSPNAPTLPRTAGAPVLAVGRAITD